MLSDLGEISGGRVLGQGMRGASGGLWKLSSESPAQIRSSLPLFVYVLRVFMWVLLCVVEDSVRRLPQEPYQHLGGSLCNVLRTRPAGLRCGGEDRLRQQGADLSKVPEARRREEGMGRGNTDSQTPGLLEAARGRNSYG